MRVALSICLLSLLGHLPAAAAEPSGALSPTLEDRVLAVVDEDPILQSDLQQLIGLGVVVPAAKESQEALHRRVLDRMIDEKLRFHEIDRFGFSELPVELVDEQVEVLRAKFASAAAFQRKLVELGLDLERVRQLVARQVIVLTYVEERLGTRVFVGLEEIQEYYDEVLVPNLKGSPRPPVQEVREQIRAVLREQRLNEEIDRWTEELRREADIVDYLDSEHDSLPALVVPNPNRR